VIIDIKKTPRDIELGGKYKLMITGALGKKLRKDT
jgi:hypothetical protein